MAVVWLDGPHGDVGVLETALGAHGEVQPLADPALRGTLAEGGVGSQLGRQVAAARDFVAAQQCSQALPLLDAAQELAMGELPTAEARPRLAEIGRLALACADLLRDDGRAAQAARLFTLAAESPGPEVAALLGRHPVPPAPSSGGLRVESEPPGATVFVDLRPVGVTPIDLPGERRGDAFVDLELAGYRKVHRQSVAPGTLAVALAQEDRPGPLVERLRAARGDASEADVAALGRRVGAGRILVARHAPGRADLVEARLLGVGDGRWLRPAITVAVAELGPRLARYAALAAEPPKADAASQQKTAAPIPAWKKWYVWVTGGALLSLVVGLVVATRVGDDKVTITVHR